MFARVMRVVDFPLLFGPTKTFTCSSNSNARSSKGPIWVTRKSRIGIDSSPGSVFPQAQHQRTSSGGRSVAHFSLVLRTANAAPVWRGGNHYVGGSYNVTNRIRISAELY